MGYAGITVARGAATNHKLNKEFIMAEATTNKVITGKVRLMFPHLFEKYASEEGQTPKYSCMILVDKDDKDTIAKIEAAQKFALEKGKAGTFGGSIPKMWHSTFRDADEEMDLEQYPEYRGKMFMNVSSSTQPGIVDKHVQPILDQSEIYSGCYVRVSLGAFAYNTSGNKGVSFGLNHVQKVADGEQLGGRTRAEDDFGAVEDEDGDDLI